MPITLPGIPYANDEVPFFQTAQVGDVLFIAHPNHPPAMLARVAVDNWVFSYPQFSNGPYLDPEPNDDQISLRVDSVVDRITLTSTEAAEFTGLSVGDLVEFPMSDKMVLGEIVGTGSSTVIILPFIERSFVPASEVYSPGLYTSWNGTDGIPTYDTTITGTDVPVAFSSSNVVNRAVVGNYLRFVDKEGDYYWMAVTGVGDILQQGAYGILAQGDILTVHTATGALTVSPRSITANVIASTALFDAITDSNRLIRLNFGEKVVHARITAVVSPTQVQAILSNPVPLSDEGARKVLNSVTSDWRLGAWFAGNYPAAVSFSEDRLTFAGYSNIPQTIHMSRSGQYYDFAETDENGLVLDDSAITFTIASDTVNQVQWMVNDGVLLIGTVGAEWMVSAGNNREALTPTNLTAQRQTAFGSAFAQAFSIARSSFYVQAGGNKLREITYDYTIDRYSSMDVTIFSEHILREHGGAIQIAYGLLPESIIYVLCADGQVACLTYEPDQQVYSWSRIIFGGPDARAMSIETKTENNEDVLYAIVQRTINDVPTNTMEKVSWTYEPETPDDLSKLRFLDCWTEIGLGDISETLEVSELEQYAGTTVDAMIDDTHYPNLAVSSEGVLVLPIEPAESCIVGYPYTSLFESFPLEVEGKRGATQGKLKAVQALTLRCRNTMNFKHGVTADALTAEPLPAPLVHQETDIRVPLPNRYDTRGTYIVAQDRPFPLTILALFPEAALHQ